MPALESVSLLVPLHPENTPFACFQKQPNHTPSGVPSFDPNHSLETPSILSRATLQLFPYKPTSISSLSSINGPPSPAPLHRPHIYTCEYCITVSSKRHTCGLSTLNLFHVTRFHVATSIISSMVSRDKKSTILYGFT